MSFEKGLRKLGRAERIEDEDRQRHENTKNNVHLRTNGGRERSFYAFYCALYVFICFI